MPREGTALPASQSRERQNSHKAVARMIGPCAPSSVDQCSRATLKRVGTTSVSSEATIRKRLLITVRAPGAEMWIALRARSRRQDGLRFPSSYARL
jgi:hypothetical protein